MLKWFTSRKKSLEPISFSILNTDIHSHFIPGIDDGAPDMETSILLIKKMQSLGYKKIITSPHIMSDFYQNSNEDIIKGLNELRKELKLQSINIEIDSVAEYYIDFEFERKIGKEKFLTFGDNYLLVELSFVESPKHIFDIIFKLQLEGYKVVLAHPERYNYYSVDDYKELVKRGVFLQINLLSLIGYYSSKIQKKTEILIKKGYVSFVGSDCHNIKHAELYEKCQLQESLHNLVNSNKLLNHTL